MSPVRTRSASSVQPKIITTAISALRHPGVGRQAGRVVAGDGAAGAVRDAEQDRQLDDAEDGVDEHAGERGLAVGRPAPVAGPRERHGGTHGDDGHSRGSLLGSSAGPPWRRDGTLQGTCASQSAVRLPTWSTGGSGEAVGAGVLDERGRRRAGRPGRGRAGSSSGQTAASSRGVRRPRPGPGRAARPSAGRGPAGRCRRRPAPGRAGPSYAGAPASRHAHRVASGQPPQRGVRAVQTSAPSSITATAHRAATGRLVRQQRLGASPFRRGDSDGAGCSAPPTARASTRRTLVSSTACRAPCANDATAAAV